MIQLFRRLSFRTPLLLLALVLLVVVVVSSVGSNRLEISLTEMLIRMVAVIGFYVFIGNSGLLSFGHVGFMCLGAYAAAWVTTEPLWKGMMLTALPALLRDYSYGPWASFALAIALCMLVAWLLGLAIMRLSGIASTITTFAFLVILNTVFSNWESLTAGTSSIIGIPTFVTPGWAWLAVVFAALLAWLYQNSGYGLMLRATRESEPAAQASGISIVRMRMGAFVISAAICGFAGALYAHFVGLLSPDALYMDATFILLAMLIVGGMQSLSGAILGTLLVSGFIEVLRLAEEGVQIAGHTFALASGVQQLGLAALLGLVLLVRPDGLTRGREIGQRKFSLLINGRQAVADKPDA